MIHYQYDGDGLEGFLSRGSSYPREFHLKLFRDMLRIRMIEEEIERRYHEDQMKTPIHLVIGQEATSVGCCAALTHDDLLYCSHRTHGNYLAKGGDLRSMLCEMFCRVNGCVGSRGGSMHLIDKRVGMAGTSAIVGGALPIAVGAALAAKMKREPHATVAVFGEAATEEGVTSESLNFAVLKQLPVIFFCENNFYSVQSPLWTRQPPRAHLEVGRRPRAAVREGGRHERPRRLRGRAAGCGAGAERWRPDVHRGGVLPLPGARWRRRRYADRIPRSV